MSAHDLTSSPPLAALSPGWWLHHIAPGPTSATLVAATLMVGLICRAAFSRSPGVGFLGASALGYTLFTILSNMPGIGYWAVQSGLVYLLLHSLRWNDHSHRWANRIRVATALLWLAQSFAWVDSAFGLFWMPLISGALVLVVCMASKIYQMEWKKFVVPLSAGMMMLAAPGYAFFQSVHTNLVEPLPLLGSFALLMFGAVTALTGYYWHTHEQDLALRAARNPDLRG